MVSGVFFCSSATDSSVVSLRGILTVLGFRRTYCIHRCTSLDTRELVPKTARPLWTGYPGALRSVIAHTEFVSGSELYLDPYAKGILHRSLYEFLQGGSNDRKRERM